MPLKRSLRMLSSSERQLVKTQWLRSGQCARCFHASIRQRAEESSNEATPQNAPKRGPTRHERSAQISNELQMLQKGPPPSGDLTGPGSVTGAYHAPPQAPTSSAGFLETPDDMGGPRMGENVSAGREGPNAQGVGRPIRYEDRGDAPQDTTILARGSRATSNVEEPAEGGASVLGGDAPNQGHHQAWIERSARQEDHDLNRPWNASQATKLQTRLSSSKPLGVPLRPSQPQLKPLLENSSGASTIASNNYLGVINDHASLLSTPSTPTQKPRMVSIHKTLKTNLIDKFVKGTYDPKGYLGEGKKFKNHQEVLNGVARQTMLNGTFLGGDVERVLGKVKSLLPAATAAGKKAGAAAKQ